MRAVLVAVLAASSPAGADPDPKPADAPRRETGVLPLVGGDTDIGLGVGALGSVVMLDRAHHPYRWQIQFSAFVASKTDVTSPTYEDAFVVATFPQLLDGRLRLELRPSFTKETTLPYYGIGNRAPAPAQAVPERDFYQRVHPAMAVLSRWALSPSWSVLLGAQYVSPAGGPGIRGPHRRGVVARCASGWGVPRRRRDLLNERVRTPVRRRRAVRRRSGPRGQIARRGAGSDRESSGRRDARRGACIASRDRPRQRRTLGQV